MYQPSIMVVEDKAIVALDIMRFLVRKGFKNTKYYLNGTDALNAIKNHKPDIALLDIILTDDISGIDIAKELKKLSVPFIFISALSNPDHRYEAVKLNPEAIFSKPVNLNDVLTVVSSIISKNKNLNERSSPPVN
jgi:DNA-binding response OmpR family regulator